MSYPASTIRWASEIDYCQICLTPNHVVDRTQRGPVHNAHIIGRGKRTSHKEWNLLRACPRCHLDNEHGMNAPGWPTLTLPMKLWVKRESGMWEPEKLSRLHRPNGVGITLPTLERLPERYMTERTKNRPDLAEEIRRTQIHSDEAEQLLNDPHWPREWKLSKVMDPEKGVWWEVKYGATLLGRGASDVEAIVQANKNRD